jgi:hypothetical protein
MLAEHSKVFFFFSIIQGSLLQRLEEIRREASALLTITGGGGQGAEIPVYMYSIRTNSRISERRYFACIKHLSIFIFTNFSANLLHAS